MNKRLARKVKSSTSLSAALRFWARAFLPLLVTTVTIQPLAFAAPNPSLVSQEPMFVDISVPANVAFIVDDSYSMASMRLPVPPGLTLPTTAVCSTTDPNAWCVNVPLDRDPSIKPSVYRDKEWVLRAPTLNPLYYNPAITYRPWNNNGVRMPNADIGVNTNFFKADGVTKNGYAEGKVPHDMRFVGPNYTTSNNLTRKSTATGANAPTYTAPSLSSDNHFTGYSVKSRNQDIFIRRLRTSYPPLICKTPGPKTVCTVNGAVAAFTATCSTGTVVNATKVWLRKENCTVDDGDETIYYTNPGNLTGCGSDGDLTITPSTDYICPTGQSSFVSGGVQKCCSGSVNNLCAGEVKTYNPQACPATGCIAYYSEINDATACAKTTDGANVAYVQELGDPSPNLSYGAANTGNPKLLVIARYYRYIGANTPAEKAKPSNYRLVEIQRDAPSRMYPVYDADGNPSSREDCAAKTTCTFNEEAQNFANWYTYYRTRLFSAIAVSADALSNLVGANRGLDKLRIGYGSINYFPGAQNPYGTGALPSALDVDPSVGDAGYVPNYGALVRGVRAFTPDTVLGSPAEAGQVSDRQQVFNWLFSLAWNAETGNTPNREALDSLGRYFSRKDSKGPWGDYPGTNAGRDSANHVSCRKNYGILVTDGEWTKVAPTVGQPNPQPLLESRADPPSWVVNQGPSGTTPLNARSQTGPLHTAPLPGQTPYQYLPASEPQLNVTGSPVGTLTDTALYYWSRDLRNDLFNNVDPTGGPQSAFWQSMVPYIVGYGISASMDTTSNRTAINNRSSLTWPTVSTDSTVFTDRDAACNYSSTTNPSGCGRVDDTFRAARAARGDFLVAADVAQLSRQIADAFNATANTEGAATGVAASAGRIRSGDRIYFAKFKTGEWSGELSVYDGASYLTAQEAGSAIPAPLAKANFPVNPAATRNIFTSTASTAGAGVSFTWANLTSSQQNSLGDATKGPLVLNYLRGDQSKESSSSSSGSLRVRTSLLGDIVNSDPLYSKARNDGYSSNRSPAAGGGASYQAYVSANAANPGRKAAVFVGANDGMLHAFDASNLQEMFAYVPRAVYPQLSQLASLTYTHKYFVDGPVVEGDVYWNNAWRTVLIGTGGAGPNSIFALDVTRPDTVSASSVLWDYTGADHDDLGRITEPGWIGSGRDGNWYYFVGNGFESKNDKARLLAIRLTNNGNLDSSGANSRILSIQTDDVGGPNDSASTLSERPNGLGGITPVYDANRNIVAIYGGDRLGRLWKFDLSSTNPAQWRVATSEASPLFVASDANGQPQPITTAPRIAEHPLGGSYIIFGTGNFAESLDKSSTQVQSVYALWERPGSTAALTKSNLAQLTLQPAASSSGGATPDPSALPTDRALAGRENIDWSIHKGWYFDLKVGNAAKGERVIASPVLDGGFVQITSFSPQQGGDPCAGNGESFFYRLNLVNGKLDGCGFADKQCTVRGVNVPTSLQNRFLAKASSDATVAETQLLTRSQLNSMLNNNHTTTAAATNCPRGTFLDIKARPGATPKVICAASPLRTWRELQRAPQ